MTKFFSGPSTGIVRVTQAVLLCLALWSCRDDLDLAETVYQCNQEKPCAEGWLCAGDRCVLQTTVAVSVHGAPAAEYPALYPFGGCDHLRLCYTSGDDGILRGCIDHPWALDATDREVSFPVPTGAHFRVVARCLAGAGVVSTARSCPELVGDEGSHLQLYLMPRTSIGPTVDTSGTVTGLHTPRLGATATPLADGRVLIAGGTATEGGPPLDTAECYDPRTGQVTELKGPDGLLTVARSHARAALLPTGAVAIFGGFDADGEATATVEVFDPVANTFSTGLPMALPRVFHTATPLLDSGEVLLVGGLGDAAPSYEIWTAEEGSKATEFLHEARWHHTTTVVNSHADATGNPLVLIAGGQAEDDGLSVVRSTMELFDVEERQLTGAVPLCTQGGTGPSDSSRMTLHSAIHVHKSGYYLLLGGFTDSGHADASAGICLWEMAAKLWAGRLDEFEMGSSRGRFSSAMAHDFEFGDVLLTGGLGAPPVSVTAASAEHLAVLEDWSGPAFTGFKPVATPLLAPRWDHDSVTTCDGRVLIVGGLTGSSVDEADVTAVTEVFNP